MNHCYHIAAYYNHRAAKAFQKVSFRGRVMRLLELHANYRRLAMFG